MGRGNSQGESIGRSWDHSWSVPDWQSGGFDYPLISTFNQRADHGRLIRSVHSPVDAAGDQWVHHELMADPFFLAWADHELMIHHVIHTIPATRDQWVIHGL